MALAAALSQKSSRGRETGRSKGPDPQKIPFAPKPWETLHLTLVGPTCCSRGQGEIFLVPLDHFPGLLSPLPELSCCDQVLVPVPAGTGVSAGDHTWELATTILAPHQPPGAAGGEDSSST